MTVFGGVADYTRVSSFADWIDRTVGGQYDLVLDMANQLPGNDGRLDTITFIKGTIPIFGEHLFLSVNGQNVFDDSLAAVRSITIRGSMDDAVVRLPSDLGMPVSFNGGGGSELLILENLAKASTVDVTNAGFGVRGQGGTIGTYSSIERLSVIGDSRDTVRVYSTSSLTPVSVSGAGTVSVAPNGLLREVFSQVSVFGRGVTNLTINDVRNTNSTAKYVVYADQLAASPQATFDVSIEYSGLSNLTINGGSGGNQFDVKGTPAVPVTLNTGTGTGFARRDRVFIFATSAPLTVNGQDGPDEVTIGPTTQFIGGGIV